MPYQAGQSLSQLLAEGVFLLLPGWDADHHKLPHELTQWYPLIYLGEERNYDRKVSAQEHNSVAPSHTLSNHQESKWVTVGSKQGQANKAMGSNV